MSIIIFLETGVRQPGGLYGDIEYIPFDRRKPHECFDKFLEMLTAFRPKMENVALTEARSAADQQQEVLPDLTDLLPKSSWTGDEYESAAYVALIRNDLEAFSNIDTSYKASELSRGDARAVWEGKLEHFRLRLKHDGNFDKIKCLVDENPQIAQLVYFLGSAYEGFQEFSKAAVSFEHAAQLAANEEAKIRYLGQAALQYARLDQEGVATRLFDEMRMRVKENPGLMSWMILSLARVAELKKDVVLQLALLEYEIDRDPSDTRKRFSLAYLHSHSDDEDMALFHYQRIPEGRRDSVAWNNLGVCYGEVDMPVHEVKAFRTAADSGDTLAMSNLGRKLLNGGFFDEAQELCQEAMAMPDYHRNVLDLQSRLRAVDDDENAKLEEAADRVKDKSAFYRELGRAAVAETPRAMARMWRAREGWLTAEFVADKLTLIGTYEVAENKLAWALVGSVSAPTLRKYRVEYTGRLRGRMFSGLVSRTQEGTLATLLNGIPSQVLMHLSADGLTLSVMENASSQKPSLSKLIASE